MTKTQIANDIKRILLNRIGEEARDWEVEVDLFNDHIKYEKKIRFTVYFGDMQFSRMFYVHRDFEDRLQEVIDEQIYIFVEEVLSNKHKIAPKTQGKIITDGRKAYEIYREAVGGKAVVAGEGQELPEFDTLSEKAKNAWSEVEAGCAK